MQVLPSDIGEFFNSHWITVVAVFIFILLLKNVFLSIKNSFVRNKIYLVTDKAMQNLIECKQVLPNIGDFAKQEFNCFLTLIVKAKI